MQKSHRHSKRMMQKTVEVNSQPCNVKILYEIILKVNKNFDHLVWGV